MQEKIEYYGKRIIRKMPDGIKHYARYLYHASKHPFDFRKNFNLFKYYTSVGKKEEINYVPPIFVVTISSLCNLRCPTCLYSLKNPHVFERGGFIKVDDFRSIIDKYAGYIETVWLTGGEPLLHPDLGKLVEIVKNKGLTVRTSTNGILIKKKINIMKSFDSINVSMDGYDYKTFKQYRGGTKKQFDEILDGLRLLREKNIEFRISFLLTEDNLDKIYEMIAFGYRVKPFAINFHNINPHGSKEFKPLTRKSEKVNRILGDIISRNDYPFDIRLPVIFDTESKHFMTSKCAQPWHYCCFDDKGNISYCCHLKHDESIGNIFRGYNFNSPKIRNFRRLMMTNQYPKDDCLYCQRRFEGEEYKSFSSRLKKWI